MMTKKRMGGRRNDRRDQSTTVVQRPRESTVRRRIHIPPFLPCPEGGDGNGEKPTLRLMPVPCDPVDCKTGDKPLAIVRKTGATAAFLWRSAAGDFSMHWSCTFSDMPMTLELLIMDGCLPRYS